MLDDINFMSQRDRSDALGAASNLPEQLLYEFGIDVSGGSFENVVIAGMGGSAVAGSLVGDVAGLKVPLIIHRDYGLPGFVGPKTLCILTSYSGNTEEVLSAFTDAKSKECQIVVVSSGGKLAELARAESLPLVLIPAGIQPRLAVWYMFRATVEILESAGLVSGLVEEIETCFDALEAAAISWRSDVGVSDNYAKQIAEELAGKVPIIYSPAELFSAAYKWKTDINENAKNVAFAGVLPEINHNEMIGWISHPIQKPFAPIEFISDSTNDRFTAMNRILSGRMPHPIEIQPSGETLLQRVLWLMLLGSFVSIYLGLINNVDPTNIDLLEKFKDELNQDSK